jgi:hypothetical protein
MLKNMVDTFHRAYPSEELLAATAVFDDDADDPDMFKTDHMLAAITDRLEEVSGPNTEEGINKLSNCQVKVEQQCFVDSLILASGFGATNKDVMRESVSGIGTTEKQLDYAISHPLEILEGVQQDKLAENLAKELVVSAMKPILQPLLKRHQLKWTVVQSVLEEAGEIEELKGAFADPTKFLKEKLMQKGGPVLKKLAIVHLKPKLTPHLDAIGLEWADVLPVLEAVDSIDELQTAATDPAALLQQIAAASVPAAKKLAIVHLKPKLTPYLCESGLEWADMLPVLEAVDSIAELKQAVLQPEQVLFNFATAGGPIAQKLAIMHLKPVLAPHLRKSGLEWADVLSVLEAAPDTTRELIALKNDPIGYLKERAMHEGGPIASKLAIMQLKPALLTYLQEQCIDVDWAAVMPVLAAGCSVGELQAALDTDSPIGYLKERTLQEGGAVAKKLAIMEQLHREGIGVEWADVMPVLEAGITVDEMMSVTKGASLVKGFHARQVIHSCSSLRQFEQVGVALIGSLEKRVLTVLSIAAVDNPAMNDARRFLCDAVMMLGKCQTSLMKTEDNADQLSLFTKDITNTLSKVIVTANHALQHLTSKESVSKNLQATMANLIASTSGVEQRLAREIEVLRGMLLDAAECDAAERKAPVQFSVCSQEVVTKIKRLIHEGTNLAKEGLCAVKHVVSEIKDEAMREVKELAAGVAEDVEDAWNDLGSESPIFGLVLKEGISLWRQSYSDNRAKKELWKIRAITAMAIQRAARGGGMQCRKSKEQMKSALMLRRALERNSSVINVFGSDDTASQLNLVAVRAFQKPISEEEQHDHQVLTGVSEVKDMIAKQSFEVKNLLEGLQNSLKDLGTEGEAHGKAKRQVDAQAKDAEDNAGNGKQAEKETKETVETEELANANADIAQLKRQLLEAQGHLQFDSTKRPQGVPQLNKKERTNAPPLPPVGIHAHQKQLVVQLTPKTVLGPAIGLFKLATVAKLEEARKLDSAINPPQQQVENQLRKELEAERAKVQVLQQERESVMSRKLDSLQESIGAAASKLGMLAHAIEHTKIDVEDKAAADDKVHWSMVEEETERHINERMAALEEV